MHLLAGDVAGIEDGEMAVDLEQPAGDIIVLSAADTEIAALSTAARARPAGAPTLRFANLGRLSHPMSVDLYLEKTVATAKLVVVRMMGGAGYWPYGLDELRALARRGGPRLVVVPGEDQWDSNLEQYCTADIEQCRLAWRYLVEGGAENARRALAFFDHLAGAGEAPAAPLVLPRAGCYLPGLGEVSLDEVTARVAGRPVAAVMFYRALVLGEATAPVDALVSALESEGIAAIPIFVARLKDRESAAFVQKAFEALPPSVVLNTTAFAVSSIGEAHGGTPLDAPGRPVLQVVLAGSAESAWQDSARGLTPQDLTMNVVLPEVDGRILTRAVSFKGERDGVTTHIAHPERVAFVARQAAGWVRLGAKPPEERRVALVLSNYPDRDGRIANGVGLDTPESAARVAASLADAGYVLSGFPETGADLMSRLLGGVTGALSSVERADESTPSVTLAEYRAFLATLPEAPRAALIERWGVPEKDPFFSGGAFRLAAHRFSNVTVAIQPQRGYGIDPKSTYHDPDLVPPHHYLAFYLWLRTAFHADAIVHLGKHGNTEWLPGKALSLSADCWPEIALGSTPLIYPFLVNDPGEGSQSKRRTSAVVVDHLMPPMTRAESSGPFAELETLIDEFYLAAGMDRRRRDYLAKEIVSLAARHGIDRDLNIGAEDDAETLRAIDAHLCDLKELQIRDGLHILGTSPADRQRIDTLVAIARVPRSGGRPEDASLHRAIACDLELQFDPLDCDLAESWEGPRPALLAEVSDTPWRTAGDTVERIEALAAKLAEHQTTNLGGELPAALGRAKTVLAWMSAALAPSLDSSGERETAAVLTALDGRFVTPGPSGAPTRGRPDVLPTGRNFYSVDVRAVPTAAAWELGRRAADALALRYFQDEGEWPRTVAMSAWGTSNMRTGGDDIAQVLALIGARPVWEAGTGRITGVTVIPLSELRRPRIDVTLKISGMFRDAFPVQIDLIDTAVRTIAALDEDGEANPIAAAVRAAREKLTAEGMDDRLALSMAGARVFGSMPGAYGTGLQGLIDTGAWETRSDIAEAFLAWGSFVYGGGAQGEAARALYRERLASVDAVTLNQDTREHDILDSDDYYQFPGGLTATVAELRGSAPRVYHGDNARPEKPVVRSLQEELGRVVRGRAANPKWLAGVMRHGYKGAFEIAATVDYLFACAATTDAVGDHHFDALYDAYIADAEVRDFLRDNNPAALREIAMRFREAIDRALWAPRRNSAYDALSALVAEVKEAAE